MRETQDILLSGGTVVAGGRSLRADVLIRDGRIAEICAFTSRVVNAQKIDVSGCIVCPGLVDVHVHLREPGFTAKETIMSGTQAAAAGGYTTVCAMPNLNPVPDSPENLKVETDAIEKDAVIDVKPYCSITKGRKGLELVDIAALKDRCVAFSDDGSGVQDEAVMLKAMETAAGEDAIIAAHCEVNDLLRGGYIHDGKYCAEHGHKGICSESEWGQIARDVELCRKTGCRYHVCHISTRESVEIIRRAKAEAVRISCETAPHYLVLCDEDLREEGRFKMNPPLRSADDRDALIEGLLDGTIDVIATDHAPHTDEEKSRGLQGSAMGIVGLETAFPVLYTKLVMTGTLSLERLVGLMSERPREIFRIGGGLRAGEAADLAVIDLDEEFTVDPSGFKSGGRATPFAGWKVRGKVRMTIKDGKIL